jgi:hypothetical protein
MKFLAWSKKYLTLIGFGMLAGHIGVGLLGPRALQWYAAPVIPGKPFTCEVEVGWGAAKLFNTQLVAGTAGAIFMVIVGVLASSWLKSRADRKAQGAVVAPRAQSGTQSKSGP